MSKILFVEDDKNVFELISLTLKLNNFDAIGYYEPLQFLNEVEKQKPDLILLDLMLPNMDGINVLEKLKSNSNTVNIPVIIISAKNLEDDIVVGLDKGASDYITKPFGLKEFISRINSNLRKTNNKEIVTIDNLELDNSSYIAKVDENVLDLTKKEFQTLYLLMINKGNVVSRKILFKEVWGIENDLKTRTLDMHIKTLRAKLAKFTDKNYIETIRGVGYIIR